MTPEDINRLVEENLPLAKFMANEYVHVLKRKHVPADFDQAFSDASYALVLAAQSWKAEFNVPFGTYAGLCIRRRLNWTMVEQPAWRSQKLGVRESLFDSSRRSDDRRRDERFGVEEPGFDRVDLHDLLSTLDSRERKVVERFAFDCDELKQIAPDLGVTGERVRQIRDRALEKMRQRAA